MREEGAVSVIGECQLFDEFISPCGWQLRSPSPR